jgi:hypothetical protein
MTDSLETFKNAVQSKDWFAGDEYLEIYDGPDEFLWWTTDSYIANTQIVSVVNDEDVDLGVIEPGEDRPFKVALYPAEDF